METELTLTRSHPAGAIAEAETDAKVAAKYAIDPGGGKGGEDGSTDLGALKVRVAFADDLLDAIDRRVRGFSPSPSTPSPIPISVARSLSRTTSRGKSSTDGVGVATGKRG